MTPTTETAPDSGYTTQYEARVPSLLRRDVEAKLASLREEYQIRSEPYERLTRTMVLEAYVQGQQDERSRIITDLNERIYEVGKGT